MNDNTKTKNDTTGTLYVTSYKFIHKTGALRNGSIVKTAKSSTEAEILAKEELDKTLAGRYKIISVKPW